MQNAVHDLALDAATREVVDALNAEGIRPLLIKGPAITRWLYKDMPSRSYLDVDLLVSDADWPGATRVLGELGFESRDAGFSPEERSELAHQDEVARHAETWTRPPGISIDLHHTLVGVGASESELWDALVKDSEPLTVGKRPVDIPGEPSRALIVALEAAKAGPSDPKGLANLNRALTLLPERVWRDAARLARRLRAETAFAAGLRLRPDGRVLAERLGLSAELDVETALRAMAAPPTAFGFQHLVETRGLRSKLVFMAREVVPSQVFMRSRFAIARRGPLGLLLAYLWRPLWLVIHAGEGLAAWRRARKEAG
jgi:Uncharacterised nucleotidyltransferase